MIKASERLQLWKNCRVKHTDDNALGTVIGYRLEDKTLLIKFDDGMQDYIWPRFLKLVE